MKKLHKQNLIITWCSILALSMVSVLGFGLSVMALKGSIVVIVCGIISTIGYFCLCLMIKNIDAGISTGHRYIGLFMDHRR